MSDPLYKSFKDIPAFTRSPNYRVMVDWKYLEDHLEHWDEPKGILELDPDFQRGHVWTEDKQIAYVEYVLRQGTSSRELLFNCSSWMNKFDTPIVLVDGKQRLEAVRKFMRNELKAFGSYCKDFTDNIRLINPSFTMCMNDLKTRKEVLTWYLDLNSGGVVHTQEELDKVKKMLNKENNE